MSRVVQLISRQIPKSKIFAEQWIRSPFAASLHLNPGVCGRDEANSKSSFSTLCPLNAANQESKIPIENSKGSQSNSSAVHNRIDELVRANKIVVFMKGVPDAPQCGFSNAVVQVLRMHGVKDFDAHNVLADSDLRQGIKDFSMWPTIPQVYINGEFIGGSDILLQLHQSGELIDELEKAGISSALVSKEKNEQEKKKPASTD